MVNRVSSTLDLRFNGKFDKDISLLFNQISNESRVSFNDIVSVLSELHINSIDWWVEGPASRNIGSSPFFHRYCCLFLVISLIDDGKFKYEEVIVDSKEFGDIIEQILADKGVIDTTVRYETKNNYFKRNIVKRFFLIPVLFCKVSIRFLLARVTRHLSIHRIPQEPLVLIDTFMLPAYTNKDRWYGSLWDNLSEDQRKLVYFVPTIVMTPVTALLGVYKRLRRNERNFLVKEDYLTVSDIFFAFQVRRRLKRLVVVAPLKVSGYDLSEMVKSELLNNRDILTVIESLLTYRFIKRLSMQGIKVRLCIDWFEGQVIDKAWNFAFKKYLPSTKRIGFRAFESYPFYLCSYPIPIEKKAGVIPDVFAVQGKGTIATVKEFLKDADVIVVPSFRSQHVWDNVSLSFQAKTEDQTFTILVTLPIGIQTANNIIKQLVNVSDSISHKSRHVQYILKLHPACKVNAEFNRLISQMPDSLLLTDEKSFPILIKNTDLLVSEASSTCLEALACGVPVIVIHNEEGLTHNPMPESIPEHLYMNVRSAEQLIFALNFYINSPSYKMEDQRSYGKWVRENYFELVTPEGVNKLLYV